MKFGQSLAEHLVPEWRDQYLDYKLGKKKLKKLVKKPSLKQSAQATPLDQVHAEDTQPHIELAEHQTNKSDSHKFNVEERTSFGSDGSTAFTLPTAVMPLDKQYGMRVNSSYQRSEELHDQTPLLHEDSSGVPPPQEGTSIFQRKPFFNLIGSIRGSNSNRKSSLFQSPRDIEMEEMSDYARQHFLHWVDTELDKVEMFYDDNEFACVERFLVLQNQIHQMENQKLRSKRKWMHAKQMRHAISSDIYLEEEEEEEEALDFETDVFKRNIKYLSFWTRRKLRIINKFDMPSLPSFEWLKANGKIEKQYYEVGYETNDLQEKKIPYFVAKRMLKKAIYELYRAMELLKSYRLMNRTGFRKLIKKYDKATNDSMLTTYMEKVDELHFVKSDVLESLMNNIEELYTRHFENGNRKVAITKLRANPAKNTFYVANYFSGLFFGCGIPLVVYAMYLGLHNTLSGIFPHGQYLLQIWGGFFTMVLMALLFGVNCLVWSIYKVSYKFIFEFNQRDALDYRQYMLIPSIMFFWLGLIGWFSFENFWPHELLGRDFPWLFLGVGLFILICPFDIFYLNARIWMISSLFRLLLSGFYPVEFRDFFLGDIFCSLTYAISNLSTFFCLYGTHWSNTTRCGSSQSRLLGFLQCIPSIWRFLQCFRRWADTGDWFPHLANMGKYSVSTLYYMSLSLYRIERVSHYKALLIFWASFNSIFSAGWDILMDWSLLQFDSENFLLRDELGFENPKYYYVAMILDVILRFQWIFYVLFPKYIQQSAITSFGVAIAELLRRFIWIFFRMENEHATNVHLFRASRESPLPYPVVSRGPRSEDILHHQVPTSVQTPEEFQAAQRRRRSTLSKLNIAPPTPLEEERPAPEGVFKRYLSFVSQKLKTAHIKDFQRRKFKTDDHLNEVNSEEDDDDEEDDD